MIHVSWLVPGDLGTIQSGTDHTFDDLCSALAHPIVGAKNAQPLVVGATFKGNKRVKAECTGRNVIPIDVDSGLAYDAALARARTMGLQAVMHTTASHTPDKPRFRIFVILAETPQNWQTAKNWVRKYWPEADMNAVDLVRISYAPVEIPGYRCDSVLGTPLVLADADVQTTHVTHTGVDASDRAEKLATLFLGALPPIGNRTGFYLALTGFLAKLYVTRAEIKAVIVSLCESSGASHKMGERLRLVDETIRKFEAGESVGGDQQLVQSMAIEVGEHAAQAVIKQALLVIVPRPAQPKEHETQHKRRQHSPAHVYKFRTGEFGLPSNKPRKITQNEIQALLKRHDDWTGVFQYDVFANRMYAVDPPFKMDAERGDFSREDITNVRTWFGFHDIQASREEVADALPAIAKSNSYHPVLEYLDECQARPGAIEQMAREVLGIADPLQLQLFRMFMIGAVKRITQPGCKVDTCLILQGNQGIKKSSFFRVLFGQWFADDIPSIRGNEAKRYLPGKWCIEFAELDRLIREEPETVRAFLTTTTDRFDEKYQNTKDFPRACVFVGTSNSQDFLRDPYGERRFWPIAVKSVELGYMTPELVAQAWGEARNALAAGEAHYLDIAQSDELASQQENFKLADAIEAPITEYLKGKSQVAFNDVLKHLQQLHEYAVKAQTGSLSYRVSRALTILGCKAERTGTSRFWLVPDALRLQEDKKVLPWMK